MSKLIAEVASSTGLSESQVLQVIDGIVFRGYTIARLRQAGWQSLDDHAIYELDPDEEYAPSNTVPIYALGTESWGVPALDLDDDDAMW